MRAESTRDASRAPSVFERAVLAARPALLARALYLVLGLDVWVEMLPHAGRYGIDGFNVAHFAWLDALFPGPSRALYAGLLGASGVLAVACALGPVQRALRWLLTAAYTLAWALSMHDSYQHHYLLSWLLVGLALAPVPCGLPAGARVGAPGQVLVGITCSVVYEFTAVAKLAPDWRDGSVLRALAHTRPPGDPQPGRLDALRDAALGWGVSDAQFFRTAALTTALVQVLIAAGYLAAVAAERAPERSAYRSLRGLGLASAWAFHVGAELSGVFRIGWFSHYMLICATLYLGPARLCTWLDLAIARLSAPLVRGVRKRPTLVAALAALAWLAALLRVQACHIPGFVGGTALGALVAAAAGAGRRSEPGQRLALAACAALLGVAVSVAPIAFDYHRKLAGELVKLGRRAEALAAYREAERVAPPGQSRRGKIRALEAAGPDPAELP